MKNKDKKEKEEKFILSPSGSNDSLWFHFPFSSCTFSSAVFMFNTNYLSLAVLSVNMVSKFLIFKKSMVNSGN
jgi:hypothetical protein